MPRSGCIQVEGGSGHRSLVTGGPEFPGQRGLERLEAFRECKPLDVGPNTGGGAQGRPDSSGSPGKAIDPVASASIGDSTRAGGEPA